MAKTLAKLITILSLLVTMGLMIYSAQPWGDNYAYKNIAGYILLGVFLAWAASPYVILWLLSNKAVDDRVSVLTILGGTVLICGLTLALLIDTVFIHIDAQGGLVFLFLPIYQWIAVGILGLLYHVVGRAQAT